MLALTDLYIDWSILMGFIWWTILFNPPADGGGRAMMTFETGLAKYEANYRE